MSSRCSDPSGSLPDTPPPSRIDPTTIDEAIRAVVNWPKWFYSLDKAEMIDKRSQVAGLVLIGVGAAR